MLIDQLVPISHINHPLSRPTLDRPFCYDFGMDFRVFPARYGMTACVITLVVATAAAAQQPVQYRLSFPEPEHHYAQVEVTWPGVTGATLEARMSRSSPGRYAVHEFAKNVFDVHVFDGLGKELKPTRPNPYQ